MRPGSVRQAPTRQVGPKIHGPRGAGDGVPVKGTIGHATWDIHTYNWLAEDIHVLDKDVEHSVDFRVNLKFCQL